MDNDTNSNNKTILLADEERFVEVAYKEGLEQAGYNVKLAKDGEEALLYLRDSVPDLIIMDLVLPKVSGFEILGAIKNDDRLKTVPIIILTSLNQESDEDEAKSYGITDFLVKSDVSLKELIERVSRVLNAF